MSTTAIAVTMAATLGCAAILVGAALRECCREIDVAIDAIPAPHELDEAEHELARAAAEDEHLDRLLYSRRPPIDPQEADLWARQLLAPDSNDRIHAEAER